MQFRSPSQRVDVVGEPEGAQRDRLHFPRAVKTRQAKTSTTLERPAREAVFNARET